MTVFDAHTHIHFPAYDKDRDEVIKRAQAAKVKMITVGTNFETSKSAIEIAEKYPDDIWATVGFHPNHVGANWYHDKNELRQATQEDFNIEKFRYLAIHPKVVAIGECGLDYYRIKDLRLKIKEEQERVFLEQIRLAEDLGKPLMIHCRPSKGTDDAYEDLISTFQVSGFKFQKIVHFFVGSLGIAKKLLELSCYFTFGGVTTFVHDYDEVIKYLPLENILLETDAPYVAPIPYRGQRNEPAYVIEVAKKLAEIKNINLERVVNQTNKNTCELFGICWQGSCILLSFC